MFGLLRVLTLLLAELSLLLLLLLSLFLEVSVVVLNEWLVTKLLVTFGIADESTGELVEDELASRKLGKFSAKLEGLLLLVFCGMMWTMVDLMASFSDVDEALEAELDVRDWRDDGSDMLLALECIFIVLFVPFAIDFFRSDTNFSSIDFLLMIGWLAMRHMPTVASSGFDNGDWS
jgi:hypothetical protein